MCLPGRKTSFFNVFIRWDTKVKGQGQLAGLKAGKLQKTVRYRTTFPQLEADSEGFSSVLYRARSCVHFRVLSDAHCLAIIHELKISDIFNI